MQGKWRRKGKGSEILIVSLIVPSLGLAALFLFFIWSRNSEKDLRDNTTSRKVAASPNRKRDSDDQTSLSNSTQDGRATGNSQSAPDEPVSRYEQVADDGRLLWAPPTSGQPIPVDLLPSGVQMVVFLRVADILGLSDGELLIESLGPELSDVIARWNTSTGVALNEIQWLVMGALANNEQPPRWTIAAHLKDAVGPNSSEPTSPSGAVDDRAPSQSDYRLVVLPDRDPRCAIYATNDDIAEIQSRNGGTPMLRKEISQLIAHSDDQMHAVMVIAPNFLMADGRKLFRGPWSGLLPVLDYIFEDNVAAALGGVHFGEQFYAEMRLFSSSRVRPSKALIDFRERVQAIPTRIEEHLGRIRLDHWQGLALKFPAIVRLAQQHTRVGREGNQTIANLYAPRPAAHHLFLATELAISSPRKTESTSGSDATTKRPTPNSLDELLAARISYYVPQQSLEFAIRDLVAIIRDSFPGLPFDLDVRIVGEDLQKDGITRNQQISDFRADDQQISQILTSLMVRANPVTTVTSPAENDQKLVWVIDSSAGSTTILVTTRAAAQLKGYHLPFVFQPNEKVE